jgi:protoporphyrin/coproporphyrin ferrochelatase
MNSLAIQAPLWAACLMIGALAGWKRAGASSAAVGWTWSLFALAVGAAVPWAMCETLSGPCWSPLAGSASALAGIWAGGAAYLANARASFRNAEVIRIDAGKPARGAGKPDSSSRIAVIALTYGEPPEPDFEAHRAFSLLILERLTLRLARIPRMLLPSIARRMARRRVARWSAAGFRSPLEEITRRQCRALADRLAILRPETSWTVYTAFEFRPPDLVRTLDAAFAEKFDSILIVPLYATGGDFTSGIAKSELADYMKSHCRTAPAPVVIDDLSADGELAALSSRHLRAALDKAGLSADDRRRSSLILALHGMPLQPPPGVDTGRERAQRFYEQAAALLKDDFASVSVGWLNHARGGPWTSPAISEAAALAASAGHAAVVCYPLGFLGDNSETLFEMRQSAGSEFRGKSVIVPCLNDAQELMDRIARSVTAACGGQ